MKYFRLEDIPEHKPSLNEECKCSGYDLLHGECKCSGKNEKQLLKEFEDMLDKTGF